MPNYHFRLPDGQEYGWTGTAAKLKKAHPDAVITGRVVMDEVGQGTLVEYQGEQPVEANAPPDYNAMTVAQLNEELDRRGVVSANNAKKADLVFELENNDRYLAFEAKQPA